MVVRVEEVASYSCVCRVTIDAQFLRPRREILKMRS